jgi:hypothetical protein
LYAHKASLEISETHKALKVFVYKDFLIVGSLFLFVFQSRSLNSDFMENGYIDLGFSSWTKNVLAFCFHLWKLVTYSSWVSVMRLGAEQRDVIRSVTASKQPENVKNDRIMATTLLKT